MPEANSGSESRDNGTGAREAASRRIWRTELIATVLLGLAAVGSGWAAYQSTLWSGEQTFSLHQANEAHREADEMENRSYQIRGLDVAMFAQYLQAITQKNTALADYLFARFRPELKTAVSAWIATKPSKNPNAPPSPFAMKEYRLQTDAESRRLNEDGDRAYEQARVANEWSDTYVLLTVAFAVVSLFAGLSGKFRSPGVNLALVAMALAVFAMAAYALAAFPVVSR